MVLIIDTQFKNTTTTLVLFLTLIQGVEIFQREKKRKYGNLRLTRDQFVDSSFDHLIFDLLV